MADRPTTTIDSRDAKHALRECVRSLECCVGDFDAKMREVSTQLGHLQDIYDTCAQVDLPQIREFELPTLTQDIALFDHHAKKLTDAFSAFNAAHLERFRLNTPNLTVVLGDYQRITALLTGVEEHYTPFRAAHEGIQRQVNPELVSSQASDKPTLPTDFACRYMVSVNAMDKLATSFVAAAERFKEEAAPVMESLQKLGAIDETLQPVKAFNARS